MTDWSRSDCLNLLLLVIGIFTFFCILLSIKISINPAAAVTYHRRYTFYVWVLGVLCMTTMFGVWMVVRPPFPTEASEVISQPTPSPCATEPSTSPVSAPHISEPATPTTRRRDSAGTSDAQFVINTISLDYSRFPIQVSFPIHYQDQPDAGVRIAVPSPVFRVTGRSSAVGTRRITYVRAGIGTYAELNKLFYGQRGAADWSDWVEVNLEVPPGPEVSAGRPIEMMIPRHTTADLANKGLIIQMKSVLSRSGAEQYPSYALSNGNVFAGR